MVVVKEVEPFARNGEVGHGAAVVKRLFKVGLACRCVPQKLQEQQIIDELISVLSKLATCFADLPRVRYESYKYSALKCELTATDTCRYQSSYLHMHRAAV